MESYHYAWLSKHPDRTEIWLAERLRDGFHVHHVDGDHSNDSPANLVLIDGRDHLALHGMDLRKFKRCARGPRPDDGLGRFSYEYYRRGYKWREIGGRIAMNAAKRYAKANNLRWPLSLN